MAIWDDIVDRFTGGGKSDTDQGYKQAQEALFPYQQGGLENYNKLSDYANQFGQQYAPYQGMGAWQYGQIDQSPWDFYNKIMGNYSESPQAKYEQEQAMKAAERGASASGMLGSGAFYKALQDNAAKIGARDQQQYFANVLGANNTQMGYLGNLQGRQDQYADLLRYLSGLGYGSANASGKLAVDKGLIDALMGKKTIDDIGSLAGMYAASSSGMGGMGGMGGLASGFI